MTLFIILLNLHCNVLGNWFLLGSPPTKRLAFLGIKKDIISSSSLRIEDIRQMRCLDPHSTTSATALIASCYNSRYDLVLLTLKLILSRLFLDQPQKGIPPIHPSHNLYHNNKQIGKSQFWPANSFSGFVCSPTSALYHQIQPTSSVLTVIVPQHHLPEILCSSQ